MSAASTHVRDVTWFASFVANSRWRFAKTYVTNYPHEYTLDEWSDEAEFDRAIACIDRWGVIEPFLNARRKYLYVDDRKYWFMGDPSSEDENERPGLINRSWVDVARYREEAAALGYEGEELEQLVARWTMLLRRAGQP
ncbi:MAG: hypothetical protein WA208_06545 [Thermoanaerobaculia bacterium]